MLKLNSNYAKSYLRDNPGQDSQRGKIANTERLYPSNEGYQYEPVKRAIQENDFRREKYEVKQGGNLPEYKSDYGVSNEMRGNKEKSYGYGYQPNSYKNEQVPQRKEIGEYQRKGRNYEEPLGEFDANYRDFSPKMPLNTRRNSFTPSYDADYQNQQNYEADARGYRYSMYSGRANPPKPIQSAYAFDKKDYGVKHTRRNEDVKTRIMREHSYGGRDTQNTYEERQQNAYDNYLYNEPNPPFEGYRNQHEERQPRQEYPHSYKNSRKIQFQTFEKLDQRKSQAKNGYEPMSSQPQFSEELLLSKQKSDNYGFDRPYLNERKEAIKKSIENTPQKSYKGSKLEPGSAQRKNSLIEKSQLLQQKLKKLNSQFPAGQRQRQRQVEKQTNNCDQGYQTYRQSSKNPTQHQNQELYSKYTPSHVASSPNPNRSSSCLRNNFRNVNIPQPEMNMISRNADVLRTKSPILQPQNGSDLPSKGEAIEKITKLNERINERIQSIISNYAKK